VVFGNGASVVCTPTPHAVGPTPVARLLMGQTHAGALLTDGSVLLWGSNGHGEIGVNSTVIPDIPVPTPPLFPTAGTSIVMLSLGLSFSGAIATDGSLYMWGINNQGQLGLGDTVNRLLPTLLGTGYSTLDLGEHGGAVKGGQVYLWGPNPYCETADMSTLGSYNVVPYLEPTLTNIASLSMGSYTSAAVHANGTLYMWGANTWGQLGNGRSASATYCTPGVTKLGTGTLFLKVSLGDQHVCAIAQGGVLYCWGNNAYGRAGLGAARSSFTPVLIAGIGTLFDVSANLYNTYALDSGNVTWGWGANRPGDGHCNLGNASLQAQSTPIPIPSLPLVAFISDGSMATQICTAVAFP